MSKETKNSELSETQTEQRLVVSEKQDLLEPDFVRVEKNIAAFGFFTPSSKRIKNIPKIIKFSQIIEGNKIEAEVIISGSMQYGMPITADQDKYLAFQKIIDRVKQEKGKVENPISFTSAELLALLGTSKNGNRYKEISDWLKVMKGTTIESNGAIWIAEKKRFAIDVFSIFDRIRSTGDELDDGSTADRNYVWLSSWYLENLNNYYLLPIDFETYKKLKNHVAKAFIPLLQIWLYASREIGRFEKRYSEICQTLNITQYKKLSDIKRFFGNSLDELVEYQYLESWEIEKTSDKKDFKIIFNHGLKFYSDRARAKRLSKDKVTQSKKSPQKLQNTSKAVQLPFEEEKAATSVNLSINDELATQSNLQKNEILIDPILEKQREVIKQLFVEFGISKEKGTDLVTKNFEEAKKQLEVYPFRDIQPKNKAGYLIDAIEKSYSLPEAYLDNIRILAERKAREDYEERMRIESEQFLAEKEKIISACRFCDENGHREIKHPEKLDSKTFHVCTHNEIVESQLEEFEKIMEILESATPRTDYQIKKS